MSLAQTGASVGVPGVGEIRFVYWRSPLKRAGGVDIMGKGKADSSVNGGTGGLGVLVEKLTCPCL